jgi:hypothetical protein
MADGCDTISISDPTTLVWLIFYGSRKPVFLGVMSPRYVHPHWSFFVNIPHQPQGEVGVAPRKWFDGHVLPSDPDLEGLPEQKITRATVRSICRDPHHHVLRGYVCAMAWGGQGSGPGARKHVTAAWNERERLSGHLEILKKGGIRRDAAYALFTGEGAVPGLGPSFFTKLLYFFLPSPDCYIMDQWTVKSVNLLTGRQVAKLAGDAPSKLNTGAEYLAFCEEVDSMATALGCSGECVEERLFSKGGRKPWDWRAYLRANSSPKKRNKSETDRTG